MHRRTNDETIQTMTAVARVSVTDDRTVLSLGLLGYSATKLWNSALWRSKEEWSSNGKIPSFADLDKLVKMDHPLWYRRLHSQSSQAILEEIWQSYKSWFGLRKKGDPGAKPPGFRRKDTLSTVTFKQNAVKWNPRTGTVRLSIPKDIYGRQFLYLKVTLRPGSRIAEDSLQLARLVHHHGTWSLHIVYNVALPELKGDGETVAIDLGAKHLAATACTDRSTAVWSGGELSSLERYFEKEKAKTTRSRSRKSLALNRKRSRQRNHLLHSFTKSLVRDADARGVSTIIVGNLKDVRTGKNWGDKGNQKLHKWAYDKMTALLTYKARLLGISVVVIPEDYTSQTCAACSTRRKANRVHRGLYVCNRCGSVAHADVNGAVNILKRYLPESKSVSWSSGCLAQPAVNRFAWRNTRSSTRDHEPGTWHTSLPLPRTESRVAPSVVGV